MVEGISFLVHTAYEITLYNSRMKTKINISRKLESTVPAQLVKKEYMVLANPLGKWTATYFNVSRKKCLIITNSTAKYTVLIAQITKSDFKNITELFISNLHQQLLEDGIDIEYQKIEALVGEVELMETDNDRQIIGIQNSFNHNIEHWKDRYGDVENWPFRYLNKILNRIPYKQLDWENPNERMKKEIDKLNAVT